MENMVTLGQAADLISDSCYFFNTDGADLLDHLLSRIYLRHVLVQLNLSQYFVYLVHFFIIIIIRFIRIFLSSSLLGRGKTLRQLAPENVIALPLTSLVFKVVLISENSLDQSVVLFNLL